MPSCGIPTFKFFSKRKREQAPREPTLTEKRVEDGPADADTIKALEHELAEEKDKVARLMAEANTNAEARKKLEDDNRDAKELLKARESEKGQKDADIQRLEGEKTTMRQKVGGNKRGIGCNR
jgi:molybdopterin converting factor small subunit